MDCEEPCWRIRGEYDQDELHKILKLLKIFRKIAYLVVNVIVHCLYGVQKVLSLISHTKIEFRFSVVVVINLKKLFPFCCLLRVQGDRFLSNCGQKNIDIIFNKITLKQIKI